MAANPWGILSLCPRETGSYISKWACIDILSITICKPSLIMADNDVDRIDGRKNNKNIVDVATPL